MNDSILLDYLFVSVPEKDLIEERWVVANRLPTYYESLRVHYLVDGVLLLNICGFVPQLSLIY